MISRLLCATDGSIASAKSVEFACEFANQIDAEVIFLDVDTITDAQLSSSLAYSQIVLEAVDEQTNKELFAAEKAAKANSVKKFSCVSAQGLNIAATIIAFAEENDCDHIVMGSTGKTGITRMLLGSVASDVVHKAHCPVTIVR